MKFEQAYEKNNFLEYFTNNLFKGNFTHNEEEIFPDEFLGEKRLITSVNRLGVVENLENLEIYEITYNAPRDPRVTLTREILKMMSNFALENVLCILRSDSSSQYRLSLVTSTAEFDENNKIIKKQSNPRRFSFLLGPGAKIRTVEQMLDKKGAVKDFDDLKERFSVEVVNKEFYGKIANAFNELFEGKLKLPEELPYHKKQEFAVRLIGRLMFCWFLKEKRSDDGVPLISDEVLSTNAVKITKGFYENVIENLFFEILNKKSEKRVVEIKNNPVYKDIPFLNGGLFDPHDEDFYKKGVLIDDSWFVKGDDTGILETLELYNFTIDENSKTEVDLSIDPEMLGRIFENLLAEINPDTGDSVRKLTGSYYTKFPVVNFLCSESLKLYLVKKTGIEHEKIEYLFNTDELEAKNVSEKEIELVSKYLNIVKILDPACGSGAFPMGILHIIFDLKGKINEYFKNNKKTDALKTRYEMKKEVILNSIYGVDIQEIAVEISKLRIFLSLIIDESVIDDKPNRNILPLPNLEFKFVCANSLNTLQKDADMWESIHTPALREIIMKYYQASGEQKEVVKKEFYSYQKSMKENDSLAYENKNSKVVRLANWDPFSDNPTDWFDPEWMFGVTNGFDIITGNPPYSGISQNKGEWITKLIEDYKYINGVHFGEKKHWLQDDYVKFIRMAENMIEQKDEGILAYINNHSFLDNPTFRGMRWHLLKTFDDIYIIDLHGNSKKKETCPDGSKDENIFDIMAGVSVNILNKKSAKKENELSVVEHFDLYGLRSYKFNYMENSSLLSVPFKKLDYDNQFYFFIPKDFEGKGGYENGFKIDELCMNNVTGIVTMGDAFILSETRDLLIERLKSFINSSVSENELKEKYSLGKNYAEWVLSNKNSLIFDDKKIVSINYRPFDVRYTYFDNKLVWRWRIEVMQHFLKGENVGLSICRQFKSGDQYTHVLITDKIIESSYISNKTSEITSVFPLYLYEDKKRKPNLNPAIIKKIETSLGLKFVNEQSQDKETFAPIDILDYIYAVLHSPNYREKYKEFLKIDFPRVPYPADKEIFRKLVTLGGEIRKIHLLEHPVVDKPISSFPLSGSNIVEKITYENGKVFINKSQFFDKVPQVAWEFYIGGYQPAQKWLKDRKKKKAVLNDEDIAHYHKIIVALKETDRLMKEIDEVWDL